MFRCFALIWILSTFHVHTLHTRCFDDELFMTEKGFKRWEAGRTKTYICEFIIAGIFPASHYSAYQYHADKRYRSITWFINSEVNSTWKLLNRALLMSKEVFNCLICRNITFHFMGSYQIICHDYETFIFF